jgi:hypothetical protein
MSDVNVGDWVRWNLWPDHIGSVVEVYDNELAKVKWDRYAEGVYAIEDLKIISRASEWEGDNE